MVFLASTDYLQSPDRKKEYELLVCSSQYIYWLYYYAGDIYMLCLTGLMWGICWPIYIYCISNCLFGNKWWGEISIRYNRRMLVRLVVRLISLILDYLEPCPHLSVKHATQCKSEGCEWCHSRQQTTPPTSTLIDNLLQSSISS